MDIGIPQHSLVRLGGKSSSRTEPLSLYSQRTRTKLTRSDWNVINAYKAQAVDHLQKLRDSFNAFIGRIPIAVVLDHIEFEDSDYYEAFLVPESALTGDMKVAGKRGADVNKTYLIGEWYLGRGPGIFRGEEHVKRHDAIWKMPKEARLERCALWHAAISREGAEDLYQRGDSYNSVQRKLERKFAESEGAVLCAKRIIGCTTTAAAKYNEDLRAANPGVLLVEEAGEILESHVLTALGNETRRMILIGDHK